MVESVLVKQLLEAGVHFGHQTKRWNPKMKPFIFGEKNGIYLIDLEKTSEALISACEFLKDIVSDGGYVLFVGTKRQARSIIKDEAIRSGMFYVNERWLGGLLTNFQTIRKSVKRLNTLERIREDGTIKKLSKKEAAHLGKEILKLLKNLEGVRNMDSLPQAVFIIDSKNEEIAVREANKLGIPVVGLVDTNGDPDEIDYIIPGNDDAIKAIKLIASLIADSIQQGRQKFVSREEEGEAEEEKETEGEPEEETTKVVDEKIEELVEGDIKLKEDEEIPKGQPAKRKRKQK